MGIDSSMLTSSKSMLSRPDCILSEFYYDKTTSLRFGGVNELLFYSKSSFGCCGIGEADSGKTKSLRSKLSSRSYFSTFFFLLLYDYFI